MKAIDALQISRAAIRTSNGAIAVLTKRNSIGEPTVMIGWRDDGSWSTEWLLKKVLGDDWEPLVERLWAGDDIEELEEECDKLKAENDAAPKKHEGCKELVCPACGYAWYWLDCANHIDYWGGGPTEDSCPECNAVLVIQEHVERTWTITETGAATRKD